MQKAIRDQVIEGDGDTVEALLQESNLTLATTIARCCSKEAPKKHCTDIITQNTNMVAAPRKPHPPAQQDKPSSCPRCGGMYHKGGRSQCPAFDQTCSFCHKVGHFVRVCKNKQTRHQCSDTFTGPTQASVSPILIQPSLSNHIQLYNITEDATELAPTIVVKITSSLGTRQVEVLPDLGADISAAGQETLKDLRLHIDNLLPSHISPRAVNSSCMMPIGKLPATIHLEGRRYTDDLHIYPGVSGTLISWKAAKGLGILPDHYPHPGRPCKDTPQPDIKTASSELSSTFPTAE